MGKKAQIQPKEELEDVNLGADLRFLKPIFISNQLSAKEREQLVELIKNHVDIFACPNDEFPLPNIDLFIDSAVGSSMFSFIDGYSGYNQIHMATKDVEKTAFRTSIRNFYYTVMPFGLKNAGATYQLLAHSQVQKIFAI